MKRVFSIVLLGLLPAWAVATEPDTTSRPARSDVVEIFRYEAASRVELDDAARNRLSSELVSAPGVDAYVVVVNLDPQRRFVSARVEAHDGMVCMPRRRRAWGFVGRLAARLGYEVATREAPPGVRETLSALSDVLPAFQPRGKRKPRMRRRVMLKTGDVEHHEDYVATILLVAGNPVTRLQVSRIVTRPIERGRRRDRASTVVLPDRDGRVVSSEGVRSILAGRGGRSRPDRGQPPW